MTTTRATTPEEFADRLASRRRAASLDAFASALEEASKLPIPARVAQIAPRGVQGFVPTLPAEAFELARQVYYLQHGTRSDAARAIIAVGLSDTTDEVVVCERLKTWWRRERWPQRSHRAMVAIRDAQNDGGLYRGRQCAGVTTGNGAAVGGKRCEQSATGDSDYCHHHDPRPEYEARRRAAAEHLTQGRRAGMVLLEPFQRWCGAHREVMLADARARGDRLHPNNIGWCLLAEAMGVDQSVLGRLMKGKHSRGRPAVTHIKAATVARYLEPLGVSFEDVYGHPAPAAQAGDYEVCVCGAPKDHAARSCRGCYERSLGDPCPYVNRRGERCEVPTRDPSGYCSACRKTVFRVHRPRPGRESFVSAPMLILALGKYLELPRLAWVARCMWAVNAGGCRDVFKRQRSLESGLVKQFRKRGWTTPMDAQRALVDLVGEHGDIPWPEADGPVEIEAAGMVPLAPFGEWLAARHQDLGSYAQLSTRVRTNPDTISKWIRGVTEKSAIRRATVDRVLEEWGDGTTYLDIYGGTG